MGCCGKAHEAKKTEHDTGGKSCENEKHLTVSEEQVVWKREYANEFGIQKGDDLECIVRKIFAWFKNYERENDEEFTAVREQIQKLEDEMNERL
jgi:hypothetical protein